MFAARTLATAVAVCLSLALLAPAGAAASTASASATGSPLVRMPVSGMTRAHKAFHGRFTVDRFVSRGTKTYAIGTLTGRTGHRSIRVTNLAVPVSVPGLLGTGARAAAVCPILHLMVGPLNLNLLGLHIHLNKVVLNITAVSGPGNLLGNLLCSVSNLLNTGGLPLQQVTGLLNILQQLVNTPSLLNL